MAEFIVLGIIPGTTFQVTFQMWLIVLSIFAFARVGFHLRQSESFFALLIAAVIMLQTHRLRA